VVSGARSYWPEALTSVHDVLAAAHAWSGVSSSSGAKPVTVSIEPEDAQAAADSGPGPMHMLGTSLLYDAPATPPPSEPPTSGIVMLCIWQLFLPPPEPFNTVH
jgi:hypothetical protein